MKKSLKILTFAFLIFASTLALSGCFGGSNLFLDLQKQSIDSISIQKCTYEHKGAFAGYSTTVEESYEMTEGADFDRVYEVLETIEKVSDPGKLGLIENASTYYQNYRYRILIKYGEKSKVLYFNTSSEALFFVDKDMHKFDFSYMSEFIDLLEANIVR